MKTTVTARVLWGESVLAVAYLEDDGEMFVGDGDDVICVLPTALTFIARFSNGVVIVPGRTLEVGDREVIAVDAFSVVVEHSARYAVPRERRSPGGLGAIVASALVHFAFLASLAHALPSLDSEITDLDRETAAFLLARSASTEAEIVTPDPTVMNFHRRASGWDEGAAHTGASGKLGSKTAPRRDTYFMVKGDADRMAIVRAQIDSGRYGALAVLADALQRTSPGFADSSLGTDPRTFLGALDGTIPGDSFGGLGLAPLVNAGGGGGEGIGIGLGLTGTGWGGCGCGEGGSLGHGRGTGHGTRMIIETGASSSFSGSLPPEAIRRVIRANFPRFRQCYDQGLKRDPSLVGSVGVRFIIDTTGAVESASLAGGTLSDDVVRACVLGVYTTLSFPEPPDGKVLVKYPIDFQIE